MFGIFKRHKEAMSRLDQQHQQVMRGFRKLNTARELLRQRASGELPPVDIVEIGDGFYVEQHQDGSRQLVVLAKSEIPAARPELFVAQPDCFIARPDAFSWTPPDPPRLDIKAPEIPPPEPSPELLARRR